MIKAIIFDCFGVLVRGSLEPFRDKYLDGDQKRITEARDLDRRSNLGHISYDEFVSEMGRLANISASEARKFLDNTPRNEKLLEYIRKNLKTDYKIGFLSNASDNWLDELFLPDQVALFDDIILSYKVSLAKPDRAIYELAAHNLGVEIEECVLVDDIERYCTAAQDAGMSTIVYADFDTFKQELESILAS